MVVHCLVAVAAWVRNDKLAHLTLYPWPSLRGFGSFQGLSSLHERVPYTRATKVRIPDKVLSLILLKKSVIASCRFPPFHPLKMVPFLVNVMFSISVKIRAYEAYYIL